MLKESIKILMAYQPSNLKTDALPELRFA